MEKILKIGEILKKGRERYRGGGSKEIIKMCVKKNIKRKSKKNMNKEYSSEKSKVLSAIG